MPLTTFLSFLILVLAIPIISSQCTTFDEPITTSTLSCPTTNTTFTFSNKLTNLPTSGKQLSIGIWVNMNSICSSQVTTTFLVTTASSISFTPIVVQYINSPTPQWNWIAAGTSYSLVPTAAIQLGSWYHLYCSLDLTAGAFYYESYDPQLAVTTIAATNDPKTGITISITKKIDQTTQIVASPASGTYAGPVSGVLNQLTVIYNYQTANIYQRGIVPTLAVEIYLSENIGYTVSDDVGGVIGYLGVSSPTNLNLTEAATWSSDNTNGLQFSGASVVTLTTFSMLPDPSNYNNSVTITFWYKINSWSTGNNYFFSRQRSNLDNCVFALYTTGSVLQVDLMDTTWNTTVTLPSVWTLLAISVSVHSQTFAGLLYINQNSQTPLLATINPLTTPYSEYSTDIMSLGDPNYSFNGCMSTFRVFTGVWYFNSPPCSTNCGLESGLIASPACISSTVLPTSCSTGKYADSTTKECRPCDSRCSACTAGTYTDCSACTSPFTPSGATSCTCPSPNIINLTLGKCGLCAQFSLSPLQCTSCIAGYYPSGTSCSPCSSNCYTCSGPLSTDCTSCTANQELQTASGTCICTSGYYFSSPTTCSSCDPTCTTCNGPLATSCTGCTSPQIYLISNNTCSCSVGTYVSAHTCLACDPTCLGCSGPANTQCTSCATNMTLAADNSCGCNPGYYLVGSRCQACDPSCLTCSGAGPNSCMSCTSPPQTLVSGACTCPAGKYVSAHSCLNCDVSCTSCTGAGTSQCTACGTNKVLSSGNSCVCPTGYYFPNNAGTVCSACTTPCASCQTDGSSCLSCVSSYYLSGSTCVSACPDGYFGNSEGVCARYVLIVPQLQVYNGTSVYLNFSLGVTSLTGNLSEVTSISINNNPFESSVRFVAVNSSTTLFYIVFNFTDSINANSPLKLTFTNPNFTDSTGSYSIQPPTITCLLLAYESPSNQYQVVDSPTLIILKTNYYLTLTIKIAAFTSLFTHYNQLYSFGTYFALQQIDILKYMNIDYPSNIHTFFTTTDSNPTFVEVIPNFFPSVFSIAPAQPPGNFANYLSTTSFISNFGGKFLVILALVLICLTLHYTSHHKSRFGLNALQILVKLKQMFIFNILLGYLLINYLWINLYIILQFQEAHSSRIVSGSTAAGVTGAVILLPFVLLPIFTARISYYHVFRRVLNDENDKFIVKSCAVVFNDLKDNYYSESLLVTIWLVRSFITALLLVVSSDYPLVSTLFMLTMIVLNIVYYAKARPFKLKREAIKFFIIEGCTLVAYITVMGFLLMDLEDYSDLNDRYQAGWLIILADTTILTVLVIYLAHYMYKWIRSLIHRADRVAPLHINNVQGFNFVTDPDVSKDHISRNMPNSLFDMGRTVEMGTSFSTSMRSSIPLRQNGHNTIVLTTEGDNNFAYDAITTNSLETLPSIDSPVQSKRTQRSERLSLNPEEERKSTIVFKKALDDIKIDD